MALPLEGVVVADLTQNVAGPFCAQILGDMGAEVIKVERPGRGDDARAWAPPWWGDESSAFMAFNRNKKSLALDLKHDAGLTVLRRLVARADVFIQSLRAGVIGELGLDFASATRLNPRLVYCSITAFGTRGPLADRPGYDPLMQAYAGMMSINGHPGAEPARVGTSIIDMGTGMWAALGIVAALRQRDTTGRAVEVTTALFETALMWVSYHAMGYLASGEVPEPQGSGTLMIAPYQAFRVADGYVMIAAASDALFARLATALGVPDLARDPRFVDNPARVTNRAALVEAITALTVDRKAADLLEALRAAGVPSAPILRIDQVMAEPQTHESGMVVGAPHPRLPDYRSIGLPLQWDGARPAVRRVPPKLGEHDADVLTWLGYTLDDIRSLRERGVLRAEPRAGEKIHPRHEPSQGSFTVTYQHLLVERSAGGHVVTVTLNRPEQMNAMNTAMGEDLLACFEALHHDRDARAIVFTGAGDRAFCAGGDLKERNGMTDEVWRAQHVIFEQAALRVLRCPAPVIAAVEGWALAGGCELAVLSDFIVASETAVFGVPETTLAIFPGIGGTQLLPRILGAPLAKELIFTGRRMKAEEAKAAGLVNHLVPKGQARAKALEIAETIAQNGPIAVRQAKKAIAYGLETDLETGMILAIEAYNATVVTEDRLEGVRAFNEKRKPQFKGK